MALLLYQGDLLSKKISFKLNLNLAVDLKLILTQYLYLEFSTYRWRYFIKGLTFKDIVLFSHDIVEIYFRTVQNVYFFESIEKIIEKKFREFYFS